MKGKTHIVRTLIVFLVVGLITLGPLESLGAILSNQSKENTYIEITTDLTEVQLDQSVVINFDDKSGDMDNEEGSSALNFVIPEGLTFDEEKTIAENDGVDVFTFDEKERLVKVEQTGDKPLYSGKIVLQVSSSGEFHVIANKVMDEQTYLSNELVITGVADEKKDAEDAQEVVAPKKDANPVVAPIEEETKAESEQKATGRAARAAGEMDVFDDTTLRAALNNKDISVINITQDFMVNANGNEINQWFTTRPNLVINGNNHTVDFAGLSAYFAISQAAPMNLTIKDIKIFGRNYYGPIRLTGVRGYGKIRYENVTYTGAQITASYEADIDIAGRVECRMVASYVNSQGITVPTLASNQVNFEATNMNFLEGSHYIGNTLDAGAFLLYAGGNVDVAKNAIIDVTSYGNIGEGNSIYATVATQGNISIHDGGKFNINTDSASGRGGIRADGASSKILVESGGELNINTKGVLTPSRHGIYLGDGASITVQNDAKLTVRSENTGNSVTNIVNAGNNSKFVIGKKATFNVYSDGTGNKQLIYIGLNATFQFADAASVDLNLNNTNALSRLIYMYGNTGKLNVDVQRVLAWNTVGSTGNTGATKEWNPMYGMSISYNGDNVTTAAGSSLTAAVQDDFRANFRTQNFKRVLFEYIPDVAVIMNDLTDNKTQNDSHVITGVTNPGAWVIFSGSTVIPAGTVPAQSINDATLYHVKADASGNFTYSLPANKYFTTGESITATAYLNGKNAAATKVVKDGTPPDAPVLNAIKDKDTTISGTAEANSTVKIYGPGNVLLASGQATALGAYSIAVPAGSQPLVPYVVYTAKATDAAGNESVASNAVTVSDTTPPTASPVIQVVNVGETFTTNAKSLVQNVQDNGGNGDDNITYTITKQPDVSVVGYTTAEVQVRDRANNAVVITIPVFVKDSSITTNDKAMLQAQDFLVFGKDFPTTPAAVDQMILTQGNVKAWAVPGGQDITSQVLVTDRGGLSKTPGTYNVKVSVEGLEKTVVVTVKAGTLEFKDITQDISFGTPTISSKKKIIEPESDLKVTVEDTRAVISDWKLSAKLTQNLQTQDGEEVVNALIVRQKDQLGTITDIPLNTTATPVYEDKTGIEGVKVIDMAPNQAQSILLDIEPGTVKANKEYTTQIEWTLENGP
ncbi:hypothetical protein PWEIH_09813 [Listeria weihenstephanensis FSL R9-0317]|uniref:WxL domain-containing protein n=1 Tax=Listeria weihenstephanensis TaxID=1006155 RepID=A0A841ZA27_9LIST|nr:pectate lyase-like adhesive domain-containing protein [Listeria weihenstephanensis]EUJ38284.1 hypothetical protein PWEIH_09813 [Listeria weihenstephanensis FSL R9-0317]MBC1501327.1 hypothetical protein [Listeria weihenstephanensis]